MRILDGLKVWASSMPGPGNSWEDPRDSVWFLLWQNDTKCQVVLKCDSSTKKSPETLRIRSGPSHKSLSKCKKMLVVLGWNPQKCVDQSVSSPGSNSGIHDDMIKALRCATINMYISTFHIIVERSLFQVPKSCSKSISFEETTDIALDSFDMFHEHTDSVSYDFLPEHWVRSFLEESPWVAYETTLSIHFLGRGWWGRSHSTHNIVAFSPKTIQIT